MDVASLKRAADNLNDRRNRRKRCDLESAELEQHRNRDDAAESNDENTDTHDNGGEEGAEEPEVEKEEDEEKDEMDEECAEDECDEAELDEGKREVETVAEDAGWCFGKAGNTARDMLMASDGVTVDWVARTVVAKAEEDRVKQWRSIGMWKTGMVVEADLVDLRGQMERWTAWEAVNGRQLGGLIVHDAPTWKGGGVRGGVAVAKLTDLVYGWWSGENFMADMVAVEAGAGLRRFLEAMVDWEVQVKLKYTAVKMTEAQWVRFRMVLGTWARRIWRRSGKGESEGKGTGGARRRQ